ncbi:hypothetical protein RND81_03G007600 [Saponaria officinalis]|uniref:Uncharacterized protein n=1 Tax=Saponaria officinalis TaxID=3572 RepID=A0AAW1M6I3_SAPOF
MATTPTQVVIPFRPLLATITECLCLPEPEYRLLDITTNNACVGVRSECKVVEYLYIGGQSTTMEDSYENAAQISVRDLMKKFKIFVKDVTSSRRRSFERYAALCKLKRVELERLEKGIAKVPLNVDLSPEIGGNLHLVSVDFVTILRAVSTKIGFMCTPIETIEHSPSNFSSWMTITPHGNSPGYDCIFGEPAITPVTAKQNLAQKVLAYLIPIYNLEIIDANYEPSKTKLATLLCDLERETYLTLKERVLGIQDNKEPSSLLVEQDCITPRGAYNRIPAMNGPPLPPKKRRLPEPSTAKSVTASTSSKLPVYFTLPSELETVFQRPKFA